jgi:hypothetical protein
MGNSTHDQADNIPSWKRNVSRLGTFVFVIGLVGLLFFPDGLKRLFYTTIMIATLCYAVSGVNAGIVTPTKRWAKELSKLFWLFYTFFFIAVLCFQGVEIWFERNILYVLAAPSLLIFVTEWILPEREDTY